jgi:hypothetical protein
MIGPFPVEYKEVESLKRQLLIDKINAIISRYESQMKFCDIEPLPYYREFVGLLKQAIKDQ